METDVAPFLVYFKFEVIIIIRSSSPPLFSYSNTMGFLVLVIDRSRAEPLKKYFGISLVSGGSDLVDCWTAVIFGRLVVGVFTW